MKSSKESVHRWCDIFSCFREMDICSGIHLAGSPPEPWFSMCFHNFLAIWSKKDRLLLNFLFLIFFHFLALVILKCPLTCRPMQYLTIQWYKVVNGTRGEVINSDTKHQLSYFRRQLIIKSLEASDAGDYECEASYNIPGNTPTQISARATLTLTGMSAGSLSACVDSCNFCDLSWAVSCHTLQSQ